MDKPAISVITPVYKVENFIERCLDSILAQTFRDWEAICVDDGSPDGCPAILERYAAMDPRFKVIHQDNAGAAVARNTALKQAQGDYILMVDSDDFIHPQLMEICMEMVRRTGADMVAYTYNRSYHTWGEIRHVLHLPDARKIRYHHYDIPNIEYKLTDDLYQWATEDPHPKDIDIRWAVKHCQPWRCMISAAVAREVEFCPGIMYEDVPWWGEILLRVGRTCIINLPIYYYYPNKTGYIHSATQLFRIDCLEKAIRRSEDIYLLKATHEQQKLWEKNFLRFFRHNLEKKRRRYC